MIAVVIRCQSYPGTFQFAAARLSGRESTSYEGIALPALGGIAHSKFEHAGRSCAIFVANTVARVSGEPGEGLAAARGLRGFAVNGNHGRLPAFNFSRRFRSPGHLLLGNARFQLRQKFLRCFAERFHFRSSFVGSLFFESNLGEADVRKIRIPLGEVRNVQR